MSKLNLFGELMSHFNAGRSQASTNQWGLFPRQLLASILLLLCAKNKTSCISHIPCLGIMHGRRRLLQEQQTCLWYHQEGHARPEVAERPSDTPSACCTADNVGMTFNEPKINCVDHDSSDALKDSLSKRQRLLEMLAYRPIIPIVSDGCTCQRVKPKQWRALTSSEGITTLTSSMTRRCLSFTSITEDKARLLLRQSCQQPA